jgi:hypothetical protein
MLCAGGCSGSRRRMVESLPEPLWARRRRRRRRPFRHAGGRGGHLRLGASSMRSMRARLSSAGASGRPSTPSTPSATTRSPLPASARGDRGTGPRLRRPARRDTRPLREQPRGGRRPGNTPDSPGRVGARADPRGRGSWPTARRRSRRASHRASLTTHTRRADTARCRLPALRLSFHPFEPRVVVGKLVEMREGDLSRQLRLSETTRPCQVAPPVHRPGTEQRRGAGDGNRTHMTSLEGWGSTIELRPRGRRFGAVGVAYRW